ncbi:TetR family transcriptional regulator [Aquirhabdus parva]|uniref:TetR family transcriptional regulator n=1 Tax=Aquirhabdus parva TaxID=2283318 RepID=A0A345P356_9GAMM|nr:TetR family transcriptional regulator [Aquirhabdus parva]AXI01715.1 TetR family transcriptional regulator [Aquirhabdus parva]
MSLRDERKQQSRQALLDAALSLSSEGGRSFGTISLREVAREAGLVPTAFYRHFQDMDELGADLVDYVSGTLHRLRMSLRDGFALSSSKPIKTSTTRDSIERFFQAIAKQPNYWAFLVRERWGASVVVRRAIDKEVRFFTVDMAEDLHKLPAFSLLEREDLTIISEVLVNLAFTWAMTWITLPSSDEELSLEEQQEQLMQRATRQAQLLNRGVSNWQSNPELITAKV